MVIISTLSALPLTPATTAHSLLLSPRAPPLYAGVITGTLATALPDLASFAIAIVLIAAVLGMLLCVVYGPGFDGAASPAEGLYAVFRGVLAGEACDPG